MKPDYGQNLVVPLLKKRDHHPSLPIQWHCPRSLRDVGTLGGSHPPPATEDFFLTILAFSAPEILVPHRVLSPCFLTSRRVVGLRRSSTHSFQQSRTSSVKVSITVNPEYTMLTVHCFPLLRHWMVVHNFFKVVFHGLIKLFIPGSLPQLPP